MEPGRKLLPQAILNLPESGSDNSYWCAARCRLYATAHFGKWHVEETDPSRHGFVENDGPS